MTRTAAKMKSVRAWAIIEGDSLHYLGIRHPLKETRDLYRYLAGHTKFKWRIARVQITELHPEQRRRKL